MTETQVRSAVEKAIEFLKNEKPRLEFEHVHERSTAHRLAVHLELHFDDWNVDCEYDRDEHFHKALRGIAECDMRRTTERIVPDIIVHHRGGKSRENNLLVVELKKDTAEDPCDRRKLELLTAADGCYQYQLGLYINISGGDFVCTWYKDGRQNGE